MSDANIAFVQNLYAAFGRGDIAKVAAACTPDVDWQLVGLRQHYPTFGAWRGAAEVTRFFQVVSDIEDFQEFNPKEFHAAGDKVFVLGSYAITVRKTGRGIASEWCHVFTLRDGRVAAFREFMDTAQAAAAYRG